MTPDGNTDDPEAQDGAIEHEDDIDWYEIIDATESDYEGADSPSIRPIVLPTRKQRQRCVIGFTRYSRREKNMLTTMLQCMPSARRDIQRYRDFVAGQPGSRLQDAELEIQRGIEEIRAYPRMSRPVVQLPDVDVWLRRRTAGRLVIVYAYLPPIYPCVPAAVIVRAVRYVCVTNVLEGVPEPQKRKTYDPDDPDIWEAIIDHEDDIDWDDIIATTEADDRAGRFAFNSDDYPTWEEAMKAMHALIDQICDEAINRVRSDSTGALRTFFTESGNRQRNHGEAKSPDIANGGSRLYGPIRPGRRWARTGGSRGQRSWPSDG
jgi:hypothetical protein